MVSVWKADPWLPGSLHQLVSWRLQELRTGGRGGREGGKEGGKERLCLSLRGSQTFQELPGPGSPWLPLPALPLPRAGVTEGHRLFSKRSIFRLRGSCCRRFRGKWGNICSPPATIYITHKLAGGRGPHMFAACTAGSRPDAEVRVCAQGPPRNAQHPGE